MDILLLFFKTEERNSTIWIKKKEIEEKED